MRYFTFNGKDSRNYFSLTNKVERPFLPPISVPSMKIPNRAGAVAMKRNEVGVREFAITATMIGLNHGEIRSKVRALADFLIYEEDKELIFSDELNRKYFARFTGDSNELEEIAYTGEGTLLFTAFDPFAYNTAESTKTSTTRNPNLFVDGDFSDITNFDSWFTYNTSSVKNTEIDAELTDGRRMNFLRVQSTAGLASGVSFGLQSSAGFDLTAGTVYTLSCLVAIHPNATLNMGYTYIITAGNTAVGNQKIAVTTDNITTFEKVGTLTDDNFGLDIYRYVKTFTATYTDANSQILLGSQTAQDFTGSGSYGLIYVADVKIETGGTYTPPRNETVVTNAGTAKAFPRIEVDPTTASTYVKVTNVTNNKSITYNASLLSTETLILDCNTNEAYIEETGANVIKNVSLDSQFFPLEVGNNIILVENEDPTGMELNGQVTLYWTERYW